MSGKVQVLLFGASGRMGREIAQRIARDDRLELAYEFGLSTPIPASLQLAGRPGVVIDFSTPAGAERALEAAREFRLPLLSGTTGLSDRLQVKLDEAAGELPVLHATNMSLGVAILRDLVRRAARALPASFDIEIVELHHRGKSDAPSGTALTLAETAREAKGFDAPDAVRTARSGMTGARPTREIGVFGLRGGDVAGEHTVHFLGESERIELTHRATDRAIFANGAVEAALWLVDRRPGRYTIDDVLAEEAT